MCQRFTGWALMVALLAIAAPAHAELPPWVYGDDQRRAPLVAEIRVEQSQARGQIQTLRARLVRIRRQSLGLALRPGSVIEIVYNRPAERSLGWAGPSPIPVLAPGTRSLAWLSPLPASEPASSSAPLRFSPAAGGKSFGPSLEGLLEPKGLPGQS